jgi:hypothetical protein
MLPLLSWDTLSLPRQYCVWIVDQRVEQPPNRRTIALDPDHPPRRRDHLSDLYCGADRGVAVTILGRVIRQAEHDCFLGQECSQ